MLIQSCPHHFLTQQLWIFPFWKMSPAIQVERTWDLVRDSGQRKLTYSSQNHCTSTLRSGRRKTIVSQTMCAPTERLSQSEIVLPLRKACYYSPLAEVGVFSTEIKYWFSHPLKNTHNILPVSAILPIIFNRIIFSHIWRPAILNLPLFQWRPASGE